MPQFRNSQKGLADFSMLPRQRHGAALFPDMMRFDE
jgi:hypothetical protein